MQGRTQLPEPSTTWELAQALGLPALGVPPEPDGRDFASQPHTATRIQGCGLWQRHPEMAEQPLVDAPRFKPRHLGGPHVKGVGAPPEGAGTTAALAVGLQQHHIQPLRGQEGCGGESGNASPHHRHITATGHDGMLAVPPRLP